MKSHWQMRTGVIHRVQSTSRWAERVGERGHQHCKRNAGTNAVQAHHVGKTPLARRWPRVAARSFARPRPYLR